MTKENAIRLHAHYIKTGNLAAAKELANKVPKEEPVEEPKKAKKKRGFKR